jgi:hypothetical protein
LQPAYVEMGAPTSRALLLPAGRPDPHDLTEDRELANVVGVVVADQVHLAEDGVPGVLGIVVSRSVAGSATSS